MPVEVSDDEIHQNAVGACTIAAQRTLRDLGGGARNDPRWLRPAVITRLRESGRMKFAAIG